jgi:hypothetical protein
MLKFIVIGLICNAIGCYWAKSNDKTFIDQRECQSAAYITKQNSVMFFETACMVKKETP